MPVAQNASSRGSSGPFLHGLLETLYRNSGHVGFVADLMAVLEDGLACMLERVVCLHVRVCMRVDAQIESLHTCLPQLAKHVHAYAKTPSLCRADPHPDQSNQLPPTRR